MNDTIKCMNGLCDHSEHAVNGLVWLVPAIVVMAYFINKMYNKLRDKNGN